MVGILQNKKVVRFAIVGGLSTLLNYGVFYCLFTFVGLHYMLASSSGFIVGVFLGYFLNRHWSFEYEGRGRFLFVKYFCVYLFSLGVCLLFLYFTVDALRLNPKLMNLLSIVISTVMNFINLRLWVFKTTT